MRRREEEKEGEEEEEEGEGRGGEQSPTDFCPVFLTHILGQDSPKSKPDSGDSTGCCV